MESNSPTKLLRSPLIALVVLVGVMAAAVGMFVINRSNAIDVTAGDWPWWRGLDQSNSSSSAVPTDWTDGQHVIWKSDIPGRGHGSPIVHDQRVILATADEQAKVLSLICLDRQTGQELWQSELQRGGLMHKSIKNSYASASAACELPSIARSVACSPPIVSDSRSY